MGKRKQNHSIAVMDTESSQLDIVETDKGSDQAIVSCLHIGKAIDVNSVKKSLKSENLKSISCCVCSKEGSLPQKEENWICLQCGARLCCIDHLKNHFNVPRSDVHAIGFSLHNFTVWCDKCDTNLPEDNKKIKICTGFIKQMMEKAKQVQIVETPYNEDVPPPLVEWNETNESESAKSSVTNKKNYFNRPSVRGLTNLGNTCFFNSVLQCLARTPNLVQTLRILECEDEHICITLKDGEQLDGVLEKSSDFLGQCLADTLVALCRPGDTSTENPLKLLKLLRKKCPQFEGYDQHDSHELLRHLLDNVRLNDLKRYRSLMLNKLGLRKANPQDVSPELQKKVKALGNEVVERVTLVPEHVFKGLLVSTLTCQDCNNTSTCVESFLDLSLPIMADKPQPPSMTRRKGSASPELVDEKAGVVSKHQLKKQAKQARKKGRVKSGMKPAIVVTADGSATAATDSHSDKGDSDADVEDNEEDKPHESGYSSEKIHSESSSLSGGDDSARTSPTTHVKEDEVQNDIGIAVCEGFPILNRCQGLPPTSLDPQPQYEPFVRVRRKPLDKWIGADGSLTPNWIPHRDSTYIPVPSEVMEGGESWRNYTPRNGLSPLSVRDKKDSQLNSPEELDKRKYQTSVCDQVIMQLEQVLVISRQEDQPEGQPKSVTESNDHLRHLAGQDANAVVCNDKDKHNGAGDCDRLVPEVSENCTTESSRLRPLYNDIDSKDKEVNVEEDCLDADGQAVIGPEPLLDSLSETTTLKINSKLPVDNRDLKDCDSLPTESYFNSERVNHVQQLWGSEDERNAEQEKKKGSEEDKESIDIPSIFKDIFTKKPEKEDTDLYRRRKTTRDRETPVKPQEVESECSVQSCLSQFTALEIMTGANKVGCTVCTQRHNKGNKEGKTVYTIASKQLLINETPQVLILHLKRFQCQMISSTLYSFRKLSKHVSFPLVLDLAPYCLQDVQRDEEGKILYSLFGVVEHSGNLNGGHYVAYIKVEDEESNCRWYCISDSYVHEVTENRVLKSQAYLLFYKRLLNDEPSS